MKTLGLLAIILVFSVGCSDTLLTRAINFASSSTGVDFCTTPSDQVKSNLKFIVVYDRSGSNQPIFQNGNLVAGTGTDPDGSRRFQPLLNFMTNFLPNDPSVSWSVVNFSTQAAVGMPFGTTAAATTYLNTQLTGAQNGGQGDGGWTDYLAALAKVQTIITNDISAAQNVTPAVSSDYVVFFVSDGAPIVGQNPDGSDIVQPENSILNSIKTILALQSQNPMYVDAIQINTGYYYTTGANGSFDNVAQQLLIDMATTGNGTALQFGAGQAIDFNKFSIPVRISKFALRDIWVTDVNAVWWNGQLMPDTDGDGLPDAVETALGSNPFLADSDGNGVSDGVEYRLTGKPCKDAACKSANANPFLQCAGVNQNKSGVGSPVYGDRDNDFLNDCEEILLGSDMNDFDSNQDYIPDHLAYSHGLAFIKGPSDALLDFDGDGVNNYYELKFNTPIFTDNTLVPNLRKLTMQSQVVSQSDVQTCYHYDVTNLATTSPKDHIRVYIMENTNVIGQKRRMRVAEKPLIGGALSFTNGDFN